MHLTNPFQTIQLILPPILVANDLIIEGLCIFLNREFIPDFTCEHTSSPTSRLLNRHQSTSVMLLPLRPHHRNLTPHPNEKKNLILFEQTKYKTQQNSSSTLTTTMAILSPLNRAQITFETINSLRTSWAQLIATQCSRIIIYQAKSFTQTQTKNRSLDVLIEHLK